MSKLYDITTYNPVSTDVFFFDNNVWMFLYGPIGNTQLSKQRKYASFFSQICCVNACVWINALVLSEFCNAWLRIEFNKWRKKAENAGKDNYKVDFVPSMAYQDTIKDIKLILPQILKKTERSSDNFQTINLESVYKELENCDFNDSYYIELAHQNKWKIVTDDADFFRNNQLSVEIITANIK